MAKRVFILPVFVMSLVLSLALALPARLAAQSDDNATPLGDIARALRKEKQKQAAPAAQTVIDNDNFSQVMAQAEKDRQKGDVRLAFGGVGRDLQVSSPDVTCNLSFNAQSGAPISDPFIPRDLPLSELVKLDGPAAIHGDSLEVAVYNPTAWTIREITVGLTIVRPPDSSAAVNYGSPKLLPAAAEDNATAEKRSDLTVLYHLKGLAAPATTTVFRQSLGATVRPDEDWHWAIVQAQGTPPR